MSLNLHAPLASVILVVDDQPQILMLLQEFLWDSGFHVLAARNGPTAKHMAENYPGTINLLITDLEMPGMDGVRLAEILNKSRPDMKIIYMSGSLEHLHRCEETFVEGSLRLEKPVRIDKLEAIMAKLLV